MPIRDTHTTVFEYPTSRAGVNLGKNIVELSPEECIFSQNTVWKNGMVKRGGQSLVTSTEVVANKKILGLHRFYMSNGTKQLLAACDTTVKYLNGTSWSSAITGLTTDYKNHMTTWGALNKVYSCNGIDKMNSWDGTTAAQITITDGIPLMALPYQDRLLTIINHATKGGCLTWSDSFSDTGANWETIANCGVRPDSYLYGMSYHSVANETAGYDTKVLLAGANGMYLFYGKVLIPPFITAGTDYAIFPIATTVGCNAPRTMCWTPKGTMWLGIDKQVYLLPFGSTSPIIVGSKIRSNIQGLNGIESIPNAQLENACAVYHNGYYILSVAISAGSYNTVQWWADIDRGYEDENKQFGPWYGPMVGQSISCFCNQNGAGDGGELIGGEATDKGYVYYLNDSAVYGDIALSTGSQKSIHCAWKTFYNPLGNTYLRKDVHVVELELLDVLGTVTVNSMDIDGAVGGTSTVGLSGSAIYWDDLYWDEAYWSSSSPTRVKLDFSPALHVRRLALQIEHNTYDDTFELYAVRANAIDQGQIFE